MNYLVVIDKHYLCYLHSLLESWWTNYKQGRVTWHIYYISTSDDTNNESDDTNNLEI